MPIKGLEKGDGVWGRGKEPFLVYYYRIPAAAPFGENGIATRRSQRRRAAA